MVAFGDVKRRLSDAFNAVFRDVVMQSQRGGGRGRRGVVAVDIPSLSSPALLGAVDVSMDGSGGSGAGVGAGAGGGGGVGVVPAPVADDASGTTVIGCARSATLLLLQTLNLLRKIRTDIFKSADGASAENVALAQELVLDLDYLMVAKAAIAVGCPHSALLHCELWCINRFGSASLLQLSSERVTTLSRFDALPEYVCHACRTVLCSAMCSVVSYYDRPVRSSKNGAAPHSLTGTRASCWTASS
jgi:hypothetical protein